MVDMHDKSKRRRIFHVNMLKGVNVHRSAESNYSVEEGSEGCLDGSSDIPVWNEKQAVEPNRGSFSVRHQPGTTNSNANALSRIPTT